MMKFKRVPLSERISSDIYCEHYLIKGKCCSDGYDPERDSDDCYCLRDGLVDRAAPIKNEYGYFVDIHPHWQDVEDE